MMGEKKENFQKSCRIDQNAGRLHSGAACETINTLRVEDKLNMKNTKKLSRREAAYEQMIDDGLDLLIDDIEHLEYLKNELPAEEVKMLVTEIIDGRHDDPIQEPLYEMANAGDTASFHFELRSSEYETEKPHVHICIRGTKTALAKLILAGACPKSTDELNIEYEKTLDRNPHLKRPLHGRSEFSKSELEEILLWASSSRHLNISNWDFYKEVYQDLNLNRK